MGSSTSGAPRCRTYRSEASGPAGATVAEAHLRVDENGTVSTTVQSGAGRAEASAARVGLGAGSAPARAPAAAFASASLVAPMGSMPAKAISPVVMVPVLSRHSVSTRARSSTDASSRASARRRARVMTPTMNERLVSSTRPSGTMATAAATIPRRASGQWSSVTSSRRSNSPAAGGMTMVSQRSTRSTPVRSSLSTKVKRRASSARVAAYESAPMWVAR